MQQANISSIHFLAPRSRSSFKNNWRFWMRWWRLRPSNPSRRLSPRVFAGLGAGVGVLFPAPLGNLFQPAGTAVAKYLCVFAAHESARLGKVPDLGICVLPVHFGAGGLRNGTKGEGGRCGSSVFHWGLFISRVTSPSACNAPRARRYTGNEGGRV